ncbi:Acetyltransferase (GNAT) domain-containing protein [Jatrophihabitans endophyticus]|uniref:Acetyltransferase (GNAT) domain-containing protein n=1 Tax=Jatrophihabitans endophyticus TaxID=1206085 RepID=A0A1M5SZ22_9ACTN|nr:GNAT family N-acetyltransferase [Jatrophihabitans endophyticus]SHH43578.1 Acetyltransferase (GNAT) domain-containing protein [Jatrophihabitans endophyticus]
MTRDETGALQALLDAAADYTRDALGRPPRPGDAVAVLDGRPDGVSPIDKFAFGSWHDSELVAFADVVRGYPAADVAYLGLLVVHPNHRRRGVARTFHDDLVMCLRSWDEIARVRLSIVATNAVTAEPFWSALGYAPTGESRPIRRDDGVATTVAFWERAVDRRAR